MVEYLNGVNDRFEETEASLMLVLAYEGDQELSAIPLPPVEMYLVAHKDHPLNQAKALNRDDLAEHVELVVADSSKNPGFDPPIVHGESSTLRALGFSLQNRSPDGRRGMMAPRHLAEHHMERGDLVEIPFEEGSRHRFEPHLVYRKDPPLGPAGRLFISCCSMPVEWTSRAELRVKVLPDNRTTHLHRIRTPPRPLARLQTGCAPRR